MRIVARRVVVAVESGDIVVDVLSFDISMIVSNSEFEHGIE